MKIDSNLVILVTGGSSGLGLALVRMLASAGAKVIIADLNQELAQQIAKEIGGSFFQINVSD